MWSGEFRYRVDKYDKIRKSKEFGKSPKVGTFQSPMSPDFSVRSSRFNKSLAGTHLSYDRCSACQMKVTDTLTPRPNEEYCEFEFCKLLKAEYNDTIKSLRKQLSEKDEMIRGLNENINSTLKLMKANTAAYEISVKQYEARIRELENENEELHRNFRKVNDSYNACLDKLSKLDSLAREKEVLENILENEQNKHLLEINELKQQLHAKIKNEAELHKLIEQLRLELSEMNSNLRSNKTVIHTSDGDLVRSLKRQLSEMEEKEIKRLETIRQLEEEVNRLANQTPRVLNNTKTIDKTDYLLIKKLEDENETLRSSENKNKKIISQLKTDLSHALVSVENHCETDGYKSVTILELKKTISELKRENNFLRRNQRVEEDDYEEEEKSESKEYNYHYYDYNYHGESYFNP